MNNFTFHQLVMDFFILDGKAQNTVNSFLIKKDTSEKWIKSDKLHKEILGQKEHEHATHSSEDWREIKF